MRRVSNLWYVFYILFLFFSTTYYLLLELPRRRWTVSNTITIIGLETHEWRHHLCLESAGIFVLFCLFLNLFIFLHRTRTSGHHHHQKDPFQHQPTLASARRNGGSSNSNTNTNTNTTSTRSRGSRLDTSRGPYLFFFLFFSLLSFLTTSDDEWGARCLRLERVEPQLCIFSSFFS